MTTTSALILVVACGVVAFALRASLTVGLSGVTLPTAVERALSFIGPAVLASMTVNFAFGGVGGPHFAIPTMLAMAVALVTAVWKRNMMLVLAVSMPVLWLGTAWL